MSQDLAAEPGLVPAVTSGDEPLFELIDGQVVELPPMGSRETYLASLLTTILGAHTRASGLGRVVGEMLFRFDPNRNRKRRPDVAFVSFDRWPSRRRVPAGNGWQVVPDLAVEVVSPTDGADELVERVEEYFEAGVRRVWLVFPARRRVYDFASATAIRVLGVDDRLDGGEILPGFGLTLAELFEVDLPEDDEADQG